MASESTNTLDMFLAVDGSSAASQRWFRLRALPFHPLRGEKRLLSGIPERPACRMTYRHHYCAQANEPVPLFVSGFLRATP